MTKDGRIAGVELENDQRGGAHSSYGIVTILYAGSMLYAIYDLQNVRYIGRRVLTNTPPCGAFRGHGHGPTRALCSNRCSTRWRRRWASTRSRCAAGIIWKRRPSPRTT